MRRVRFNDVMINNKRYGIKMSPSCEELHLLMLLEDVLHQIQLFLQKEN